MNKNYLIRFLTIEDKIHDLEVKVWRMENNPKFNEDDNVRFIKTTDTSYFIGHILSPNCLVIDFNAKVIGLKKDQPNSKTYIYTLKLSDNTTVDAEENYLTLIK